MIHAQPRRAFALTALLLCSSLLLQPLASSQAQDFSGGQTKTMVVAAVSGYDAILKDVGYIGALAGMPQSSQMIEGTLALFTQGKGLVGLDKTRPWGVLLQSNAPDSPIVCLPVTDLDALVSLGAGAGIQIDDLGDGVRSLVMQNQTIFIKGQGDWAYAAKNANQLAALPGDPSAMLKPLVAKYDIGVRVLGQNVPPMFKQMAVGGLQSGLEAGLQPEPGEPEEQFAKRKQIAMGQVEGLKTFIEEANNITVGIAVNPPQGGALVDVIVDAVPGSKLASQMQMYQGGSTRFSGFLDPSASVTVASAYKIPAEVLPQVVQEFDRQMVMLRGVITESINRESMPNEEVKQTVISAVEDLLSSLEAMVKSGEYDMVGRLNLEVSAVNALGAIATPKPGKIDTAIKKLVALAENDPKFPGINWNAETHAGVEIHTFAAPVPDRDAADVLGDTLHIALGKGPDAYYFALGLDCVSNLKQAIDASAASGSKKVKPIEMTLSLDQLMTFAGAVAQSQGEDASVPMMMAQLLSGEAKNKIRFTADGVPNGLHYQIVIEEGVLKAIGAAAAAAQKAGAIPQ